MIAALLLWRALLPTPARAAFELRDASPAALGHVSTDGAWFPFEEEGGGWRGGMSRASLYDADGLTHTELDAALCGSRYVCAADYVTTVSPGARESAARLQIRERAARSVSLALRVERLDFSPDEGERWGGWTLGALARGALGRPLAAWIGADRILESPTLGRESVPGSLELGAAIRSEAATLAILDRWDPEGAHAPRLTLEVPLGDAARLVLGRGSAPGRIGAALSVRVGGLEVAWGRLDYAFGGTLTAVRVGIGRKEKRRPALPEQDELLGAQVSG